jgi:hypothetical protein
LERRFVRLSDIDDLEGKKCFVCKRGNLYFGAWIPIDDDHSVKILIEGEVVKQLDRKLRSVGCTNDECIVNENMYAIYAVCFSKEES